MSVLQIRTQFLGPYRGRGCNRGCWAAGPSAHSTHGVSGCSLAGALKLVQIPAGARHIQIEELEKAPHRMGECRVLGGAAGPQQLPPGLGKLGA